MNRPDRRNAFSAAMLSALGAVLTRPAAFRVRFRVKLSTPTFQFGQLIRPAMHGTTSHDPEPPLV
jgi:enoyl-CoA hydratase/carnithine racemase